MAIQTEWPIDLSRYSPDNVALRDSVGRIMSYRDLSRSVDQLASYLLKVVGDRYGTVAICFDRSFQWIIAALAAMRVGAAYVPLDPAWPDERLQFVLSDSGADAVISTTEVMGRLAFTLPQVDLCRDAAAIARSPAFEPEEIAVESLAYVIYTSGSSGVPKGVEITHANLAHLIRWHCSAFAVTSADRSSHLAGLGFDAAGWEVWPYIAAGATVCLVHESIRSSPEQLKRWFLEECITIGFVPTALAAPMTELAWPQHTSLRYLLTGGDTLHRGPSKDLPFSLVNNYGPTECSVVATSGVVSSGLDTAPTIGSAITGTSIYVLDPNGAPAEAGEIFIGGDGVGRGYRNLPALTAEKFVADPFSHVAGARMYRTGDQAILLTDGQLLFKGRLDQQEKIRGQRVELDEISSVLHLHPSVAFAAVIARQEGSEKQLIAHVLLKRGEEVCSIDLQEFLADKLPSYMIPAVFVRMEAVPLTANGKFDRSALATPTSANMLPRQTARGANSPTEEMLLALVRRLLGIHAISVKDDFFLSGGHSLLGTQLVLRIRESFGIEFTLRDLFEAATVERLASRIEGLVIADLSRLSEEEVVRQRGS